MWQEKSKVCQSGIGVGASFLKAGRKTGQTFQRLPHSRLEWANNCTPDTCDQPHVNTDSAGVSWGDKRCCFCFPNSRERSKFVCMLNTFTMAPVGNDFHCEILKTGYLPECPLSMEILLSMLYVKVVQLLRLPKAILIFWTILDTVVAFRLHHQNLWKHYCSERSH